MNPALVEFLKHPGPLPARPDAAAAAPAETAAPRPATAPLTVLVLEGEYRLTGAVLFCLSRQPGVRAHLLSRDARSPYRFSHYVRSFHLLGPESPAEVFVAFVQNAACALGADVLLPVDVAGMRFVIEHRAALAAAVPLLPLPASAYYEIATDKGLLGAFMQEHNIPAPDTIVDIRHNLAAKLAQFEFPVLLKPIEGAGGRGIVRYATPEALLAAVAALPEGSRYIVQNCIAGYDIDCNVLYQNGQLIAHSIQKGLVATGDEYAPTEAIEFVHHDAVLAVVDRLMKALRWNGVAHLDLRYDARARQIKVIEINTRFWLTVVGSAVTARVNFPVLACRVALGQALVPGFSRLGRYIPLARLLAYRLRQGRGPGTVRFAPREVAIWPVLGDLLPRLYRLVRGR